MSRVYLAGPMSEDEAWRDAAEVQLADIGLEVVRPYFLDEYRMRYGLNTEEAAQVLTERDRRFATESDYVLANFSGAAERSLGTAIELGWADCAGVTIVTVLPYEMNPHEHPMVRSVSTFLVATLGDAIQILAALEMP